MGIHFDHVSYRKNSDTLPTRFVPVSDPRPVVTLADLEADDVDIAGGKASFTISGEVTDAIADIIPNNLANIETVRVLVDGEEYIVPTALEAGDGGDASFWRRHPFKGVFEDLAVSVPAEGSHVVTVETAANAAGSRGQDSLLLSFHSAEETFFGGTNFAANIYIATNLTNTVADSIRFYHDERDLEQDDPLFTETSAASLVFTGRTYTVGVEVSILGFSGLTTNVDSLAAEMRYNISTNYQPVYSNLFVETSATSGLFRSVSAFTVGRGDLTVVVTPLGGTPAGTYIPVVSRIKGPADLLGTGDYTLGFMGDTFDLEEEDGWYYPKGGSPALAVVVPDPTDSNSVRVTYFDFANGIMKKVVAADWGLKAKVNRKELAQSLFFRDVRIINLFSIEAHCDKFGDEGTFGFNPVIFFGDRNDFGNHEEPPPYWWLPGTPSAPSSKALKVFFKYIKDANDEPGSFDIGLKANVLPVDIPDNQLGITWALWDGTSGSYNKKSGREVEFQNPTKGGLYRFRMNMSMNSQLPYGTLAGSAWVLLPKAGGEIKEWMVSEVPSLVTRAQAWENDVRAIAAARGLNPDKFLDTAWISIATHFFDYQGVVGNPTRRYSFTDNDRPVGHVPDKSIAGMKGEKGNGDWDEPSYATLAGIVVHRAKINNVMYAVWGRELGYATWKLKLGASANGLDRDIIDSATSQEAVKLGSDLYDLHLSGGSLLALLTKEKARSLQTPDTLFGLNDLNLWPDTTPVSHGFELPEMPRDYDRLILGPEKKLLRRLYKWLL